MQKHQIFPAVWFGSIIAGNAVSYGIYALDHATDRYWDAVAAPNVTLIGIGALVALVLYLDRPRSFC